jgi:hypothetical protein
MKSSRRAVTILVMLTVLATASCLCFPNVRPALAFTPDRLPEAQPDVPYQIDIFIAQNTTPVGDMYISEGSLPAGLTFEKLASEDAGRISGTPVETGTFTITVSVWCYGTNVSGQTGEKTYTLVVGP